MLLSLATGYVPAVAAKADVQSLDAAGLIAEPVLLPDKGIWHPLSPEIYQTAEEYFKWYETTHAPAADLAPNAPVVGVVLQKSHINTGSAGQYQRGNQTSLCLQDEIPVRCVERAWS